MHLDNNMKDSTKNVKWIMEFIIGVYIDSQHTISLRFVSVSIRHQRHITISFDFRRRDPAPSIAMPLPPPLKSIIESRANIKHALRDDPHRS
jgi:hypothetical protein